MKMLRERRKFHGMAKQETLEHGRYTIQYQAIDDRKHPDEVKAEGDSHSILFEVFDGDELTYEFILDARSDAERIAFLEGLREEIKRGEHDSRHPK